MSLNNRELELIKKKIVVHFEELSNLIRDYLNLQINFDGTVSEVIYLKNRFSGGRCSIIFNYLEFHFPIYIEFDSNYIYISMGNKEIIIENIENYSDVLTLLPIAFKKQKNFFQKKIANVVRDSHLY